LRRSDEEDAAGKVHSEYVQSTFKVRLMHVQSTYKQSM
jgi:hypothetical protein